MSSVSTPWHVFFASLQHMRAQDVEDYRQFIKELMASTPAEKSLWLFTPEQRLAGLAPEQQILALSDKVLRTLPDEYLRALPADVIAAIRTRIGRPAND